MVQSSDGGRSSTELDASEVMAKYYGNPNFEASPRTAQGIQRRAQRNVRVDRANKVADLIAEHGSAAAAAAAATAAFKRAGGGGAAVASSTSQ